MPTRQSLLLAVAVSAIGRAAASGGGASPAAATEEEGSCVTSLTASNFEKEIRGKHALVVFFAPWCGHCQALHPHFENLCRDLSDQDDFLAAVVDATEEEDLARSHGVTGFPTINWYGKREFSIGKGESYSGSRSVAGLLDFVNSKTGWGIAPGGGLDQKAGLVKKMDLLVKEWVTHARLPEHLIEPARETVLVRARATADGLMQEGEKRDAKTYISIFEKVLWKDENHVQAEQARLRRLLHEGQAQMSTSKKRELGRRLNVLRVFEHFQEKLLGSQQQVTVESTHTIYTREQLARFSPDELIEIVLEMQEKGCDTDDELEVSGGDLPHLWMKKQDSIPEINLKGEL